MTELGSQDIISTRDKRRIQRAYLNNNKNIFVDIFINYNVSDFIY